MKILPNLFGKNILLDTSVVVHHLRGKSGFIIELEGEENFFLPCMALAELYAGAFRSAQQEKNLLRIENFLKEVTVLFPNDETTKSYGHIFAQLARTGKTIPQNDIWIAAIAMEHDLPLATSDRHFEYIDGLKVLHHF